MRGAHHELVYPRQKLLSSQHAMTCARQNVGYPWDREHPWEDRAPTKKVTRIPRRCARRLESLRRLCGPDVAFPTVPVRLANGFAECPATRTVLKSVAMSEKPPPAMSALTRVILSLLLPVAGAVLFTIFAGRGTSVGDGERQVVLQLAGMGLVSLILGARWYGLSGLGLRGHRALYAGIGFAVLAWVAFLLVRFFTVEVVSYGTPGSGRAFIFLLLFEAFCIQVWAFGLVFRSVADWRGPLAAAVAGGVVFAAVAFLLFQEAFVASGSAVLYFGAWGVLYGVIRLRTGGFLGMVIVQAMQSWTGWRLLAPGDIPDAAQLRNMYLISSVLYAIIIWRLWPRRENDYRI